jgi:hypothetical protein
MMHIMIDEDLDGLCRKAVSAPHVGSGYPVRASTAARPVLPPGAEGYPNRTMTSHRWTGMTIVSAPLLRLPRMEPRWRDESCGHLL